MRTTGITEVTNRQVNLVKLLFQLGVVHFFCLLTMWFCANVVAQPRHVFDKTKISGPTNVANEIRSILQRRSFYLKKPYPSQWQSWEAGDLKRYLKQIDSWSSLGRPKPNNYSAVGIGADLYLQSGKYFLLPYQDGSLMYSGVKERVQLLTVDKQPVANMSLSQVSDKLKKPVGQPIHLEFCPANGVCVEPLSLTVTPQPFRFQSLQVIKIGHHDALRLLTFSHKTPSLLKRLIQQKKSKIILSSLPESEQNNQTTKQHLTSDSSLNPFSQPVIIDLRDNWGGDLMAALDTAALFLRQGDELASFVDKYQKYQRLHVTNRQKIHYRYPFLLIVSERTASAGEIFAGILAHYGVAIIIGEKTFGKCVSQTEKKLSDGQILHFTNFEVRLPEKKRCDKLGIMPQRILNRHQIYNEKLLSGILSIFIKRELE